MTEDRSLIRLRNDKDRVLQQIAHVISNHRPKGELGESERSLLDEFTNLTEAFGRLSQAQRDILFDQIRNPAVEWTYYENGQVIYRQSEACLEIVQKLAADERKKIAE